MGYEINDNAVVPDADSGATLDRDNPDTYEDIDDNPNSSNVQV